MTRFSVLEHLFPVLKHPFPVLEQGRKLSAKKSMYLLAVFQLYRWFFGQFEDTKMTFRNQLTFTKNSSEIP